MRQRQVILEENARARQEEAYRNHMLHQARGVRLQNPNQQTVPQPNLRTERECDQPEIVNHRLQVFHDLVVCNEEEDAIYDERYHVLIREYNHLPQPNQQQQLARHVCTIHERKEVHPFISHVPWRRVKFR